MLSAFALRVWVVFLLLLCYTGAFAQKLTYTGTVKDSLGNPLAGVNLRLEPDNHVTHTDAKGRFAFKNLYPGTYTLYATSMGYKEYTSPVVVGEGAAPLIIQLTPGHHELDGVTVANYSKGSSPDNLLNLQRSAMPVTVITRETIEKMGSRRLDEVLKEQTGVAVVSDISGGARATGIQLQGFSSEYVMILIDGQPMVGRNSGNFDLSRISVTNIERIEIIKGASSCLFGSEALGGAISIVTRYGAVQPQARAALYYGSMNITDATLEGETPFANKRGSANLSVNYYHSDGFNTDKQYISKGTTAPPYDDYSIQGRVRYRLTKNGTIGFTGRFALRRSFMEKVFGAGTGVNTSGDKQDVSDLNLSAYYSHDYNSGIRSMSRYYFTGYTSDMNVMWQQQNTQASAEKFSQQLHRFEQQWAYAPQAWLKFTGGAGGSLEVMNNQLYTDVRNMTTTFAYVQGDWQVTSATSVVGGVRYDKHFDYGGKLNPSIGLQQKITSALSLKVAAGTGFKTPDFRNRYQVFFNPLSNYMVIGTEVLEKTIRAMQAAGEISEVRERLLAQTAGNLQAEKSTSLNAGLQYTPLSSLKIEAGIFHHSIRNQINSIQVATGTGNRLIYTYQNLPRAVNKGLEASVLWKPIPALELNAGYQYIIAKDKSVEDSIRSGNFPYNKIRNNETGATDNSKASDYWGIENRSRHMGNIRVFYSWHKAGIYASFRVTYRSKYAFGDANNNGFVDRYDHFVSGFFQLNATIEKRLLKDHLRLRITADNIMDYTDRLMPAQPGRVLLAGAVWHFYKD